MTEGNSCWNGGQPGVSDTLASALWCADAMLRFARLGWVGVNWHGGGNGHYSPIVGAPSTGFSRRPEFYGIQFRSEEHTSELQSLMRISYAVFCLKKKN